MEQLRTESMPEVFPEWRDQSVDDVLYLCRELLEDTTFPTVKRWREAGGKVVGHFQVYFPEEIAHAAGRCPSRSGARRSSRCRPTRASGPTCARS